MFPVINRAETIALRQKHNLLLILQIRCTFVQSDFTIYNQI